MTVLNPNEQIYGTKQTAEFLDVNPRTIYRWIKSGQINYSRTGTGRYLFTRSEIDRKKQEKKYRNLDKIENVILSTIKSKKIAYLREMQISLEDLFIHEDITDFLTKLASEEKINTTIYDKNRWYYDNNITWEEVVDIALEKKDLLNTYDDHPRQFVKNGVVYDDYSEYFIEDALIKTGYTVVSKNAHYFDGKEYHKDLLSKRGRRRDLDYIAYLKSKDIYLGIQVKNRLEYPKMDDVYLLLDMCDSLDLYPVLICRVAHPNTHKLFNSLEGTLIQFKRYFLQPEFPRDKYAKINGLLRIPLGVYRRTPDFLFYRFMTLSQNI